MAQFHVTETRSTLMTPPASQPPVDVHEPSPEESQLVESSLNLSLMAAPNPPLKKFIIYLEPGPETLFYQSILAFFEKSKSDFGPNEAHMYHPHTSVTGFFDMPDIDEYISQAITYMDRCIAAHFGSDQATPLRPSSTLNHSTLDSTPSSTLSSFISTTQQSFQSTPIPVHRPVVSQIHRRAQGKHLSIGLQTPAHFNDFARQWSAFIAESLKQLCNRHIHLESFLESHATLKIRLKEIDHISLAYRRLPGSQSSTALAHRLRQKCASTTAEMTMTMAESSLDLNEVKPSSTAATDIQTKVKPSETGNSSSELRKGHLEDGPLDDQTLNALEALARDMVNMNGQPESWYLVLHEVEHKSNQIGVPHRFKPLRRYRIA